VYLVKNEAGEDFSKKKSTRHWNDQLSIMPNDMQFLIFRAKLRLNCRNNLKRTQKIRDRKYTPTIFTVDVIESSGTTACVHINPILTDASIQTWVASALNNV
jgi:hypothetical protein